MLNAGLATILFPDIKPLKKHKLVYFKSREEPAN